MVAIQQYLPGTEVKLDNRLARDKIHFDNNDKTAARIWASLIACIKTTDSDFQDSYVISARDIFKNIDGGSQYKQIENSISSLTSARVTINLSNSKKTNLKGYPFFSYIDYSDGIITASFNKLLKNYLLDLKELFTQYNLIEFLGLQSSYSQKLFRLLKSYESLGKTQISLKFLHEFLNVPSSLQANFKDFRINVLEKSKKDIEENTSFRFIWQAKKNGRAVSTIIFYFANQKEKIQQDDKELQLNFSRQAIHCVMTKAGDCTKKYSRKPVCQFCIKNKFATMEREYIAKNGPRKKETIPPAGWWLKKEKKG